MTPRQVSKDQRRLKEKIEKERIERSNINCRRKGKKRKRNETRESLFVNVFSSTVCDVILQKQKGKHVKETDEGLTPTKDEGTCLRRLSMFRKEVH